MISVIKDQRILGPLVILDLGEKNLQVIVTTV